MPSGCLEPERSDRVDEMSAHRYRTPGDSEFVEALGWCVWNFLYLEETIVRWLWLLRASTRPQQLGS